LTFCVQSAKTQPAAYLERRIDASARLCYLALTVFGATT
jgi:hypothetical protein